MDDRTARGEGDSTRSGHHASIPQMTTRHQKLSGQAVNANTSNGSEIYEKIAI